MKYNKIIVVLVFFSCLFSQIDIKSIPPILKSAILPGWGELDLESKKKSNQFFIQEASIWVAFLGLKNVSASYESDYRAFATLHAETDMRNKPYQYSVDIGDYNTYEELSECIVEYNENRFLNHIDKIKLVKGDANITIPKYIEDNKYLIISLLYLDFDIYKPTKTALKYFLSRMSKGSIIAFDEINNKDWPGETMALLESLNINNHKIESFPFEPNVSYMQL